MLIAVVAVVVGLVLASLANAAVRRALGDPVVWDIGVADVVFYFLLYVIGMATGFAFGALLLNTAGGDRRLLRLLLRAARPVRARRAADGLVRRPPALDRLRRRPDPAHRRHASPASEWAQLAVVGLDLAGRCRWPIGMWRDAARGGEVT